MWIPKLIKQGCFASLIHILGPALFGLDFIYQFTAAATRDDGHKLDIEVSEGPMLRISASVAFAVRDTTADRNVIGKIPVTLTIQIAIGEDGSIRNFSMSANVRLGKRVVNWNQIRKRTLPLASRQSLFD